MEFKKLELEPEKRSLKEILWSRHTRRTLRAVIIGASLGFLYFYFTDGKHQEVLITADILRSLAIGGFFGLFITNSPCARGRC